jgi:hypothetical protein
VIDKTTQLESKSVVENSGLQGTVITFKSEFFDSLTGIGDHYIRFRIPLRGALSKVFTNPSEMADTVFPSSFARTDIVEFRLNEKRNFGEALKREYPSMRTPAITTIHYFLVRNIGTELVTSHANFRKMRRLEPHLWDGYLAQLGKISAEDMVIYHWRANDAEEPIKDFIALAIFRRLLSNIYGYVAAILVFGAMGSSIQAVTILMMFVKWMSRRDRE